MKTKWLGPSVTFPGYLTVCTSEKQFLAAAKRLGCKEPGNWITPGADATLTTFSRSDSQPAYVVSIRPRGKRSRAAWAAMLVHESAHVWQRIRRLIGEHNPSDEFEAYALQSITQEIFQAVGL